MTTAAKYDEQILELKKKVTEQKEQIEYFEEMHYEAFTAEQKNINHKSEIYNLTIQNEKLQERVKQQLR